MNIWAYARRAWELQEVTTAAMGCEAALKSDPDSPGVLWTLVLLPVPGSSRASSLPHKPHSASISQVLRCMNIWAYARRAWELQEVTTAAMGCEAALKSDPDSPGVLWTLVLLPVPGSSRASSLPHKPHSASISQVLRCMNIWAYARRAWELQEVTTAAMGCEAALKSDPDSPGVLWTLVLLPVPGSSRASSLPHKPHSASISQVLRCMNIWAYARRAWELQEVTTAAMGCEAALKSDPDSPGVLWTLVLLPVPGSSRASSLPHKPHSASISQVLRCMNIWAYARRAWELQEVTTAAMGCEAALKSDPDSPGVLWTLVLLPVPGSSRASSLPHKPHSASISQVLRCMNIWAYARRAWELQEVTTAAMGCEAALKSVTSIRLVYWGHWFCCRFPAVRGQVRSYENREIADKRSVARSAPTAFGQNQKQTGV